MDIYCKNCKKTHRKHISETISPFFKKIYSKKKSKRTICLTERAFISEIEGKFDLESKVKVYPKFFAD